jgi:hypothetical protein
MNLHSFEQRMIPMNVYHESLYELSMKRSTVREIEHLLHWIPTEMVGYSIIEERIVAKMVKFHQHLIDV